MKKIFFWCALLTTMLFVPAVNAQWVGGPRIAMQIKDKIYTVMLEDNIAAQELAQRLPITLNMSDLNGKERYHYLAQPLPALPENIGFIENGDILLWNDDCLVIFHEKAYTENTYTRIGRVENPADLGIMLLGHDEINITFSR